MKLKKDQLLIVILVAGFLLGSFYVNKSGIRGTLFTSSALKVFGMYEIDYKEYFIYITKERVGMLFLALFSSNVRWKQIYAGVVTWIIGAAGGAVFAMAIEQMGIKGGIVVLCCLLPHFIFYSIASTILINCWMNNGRWNWTKTCGIIIFMLMGILSEVYINPVLVKIVTT